MQLNIYIQTAKFREMSYWYECIIDILVLTSIRFDLKVNLSQVCAVPVTRLDP